MTPHDIADRRLRNQRLTAAGLGRPEEVVAWLGAVQAQEFEPAMWALGLRLRRVALAADIERAFNEGRLFRTHVMRPTWHFVTPADIRWMQALTAPHVQGTMAPYNRRLELDPRTLSRSIDVVIDALRGGKFLTRQELSAHVQRAGIHARGQRLAHIMMHAELECVVCSGPRIYDEYVVAYRDRFVMPHGPSIVRRHRDKIIFQHALVMNGRIEGTWRLSGRGPDARVVSTALRRLTAAERRTVTDATNRYTAFKTAGA